MTSARARSSRLRGPAWAALAAVCAFGSLGAHGCGGPQASSTAAGGLSDDQVRSVVQRERGRIESCRVAAAWGRSSTPRVELAVEIEVTPSGSVTRARVSGDSVPGLDACLERVIRGWRFPPTRASTQTSFPLVFE